MYFVCFVTFLISDYRFYFRFSETIARSVMFFRKVLLKGLHQRIEKLLSRSLLKKRLRHRFLSSFEFFKILTFRQNIQVTYSDFLQRIRVAATGNSVFWDIGFRKFSCSIKRKTSHIYRFSMILIF